MTATHADLTPLQSPMGNQTCSGERCCGSDPKNKDEIIGPRAKAPDGTPGFPIEAPMTVDTAPAVPEANHSQGGGCSGGGTGEYASPVSPEPTTNPPDKAPDDAGGTGGSEVQVIEDAARLVARDNGLVLGFREPSTQHTKLIEFGTRKPPLGMDFTKTEPVTVKRVRKDSPADELGVDKGWEVVSVNGETMEGRAAADVFFRMKTMLDAAIALGEQQERPAFEAS